MASFNQKFRVKSALQSSSNKFDFFENHTSSCNFMNLVPLYKRLLIPRSSISTQMEAFARLNAMTSVNYGRADFNARAFFVPLRCAWYGWNEFITDVYQKGSPSVVSSVPFISNSTLVSFSLNSRYSSQVFFGSIANVNVPFDFAVPVNSANGYYRFYVWTSTGRAYFRILRSLGYSIFHSRFDDDGSVTPVYTEESVAYRFNALPLLSLARVCYDWYYPSQYSDSLISVSNYFYRTGSFEIDLNGLVSLLALCADVSYSPDYFTAAFDNPNTPNNNSGESAITFETGDGYTDDGQRVNADDQIVRNNTPSLIGTSVLQDPYISTLNDSSTGRSKISQFTLDTLEALSSYLKRNQLAGSRVIDRYLSRYGVRLDSAKIERSIYLSGDSNPLQFGTVFSQSDSGDAIVGDYNGTGSFSQNKPSSFSCDAGEDFGYFFILGSFVPRIGYTQGVDRDVLYTSKFDFFTPEWDALGSQAISASELYSGVPVYLRAWSGIIQNVFGFTPRYSEYKVGRDRMTGDFSLNSMKDELSGYTLNRLFDEFSFPGSNGNSANSIKHSLNFVRAGDASQFNRIFYVQDSVEDHIRLIAQFRSTLYAPMKQLYDVYDWEKHMSDGVDLTVDSNGAKLD